MSRFGKSRPVVYTVGYSLVILIGLIDSITGVEVSFAGLYVIPIFLVSAYTGFLSGVVSSFVCVAVYFVGDTLASVSYANSATPYFNSVVRLGFFLFIAYAVSKRKAVEEKLRQSEERFRLLVEGVKDYVILMLDPEGNIITWNEAAERIYGYTEHEVVGKSISIFYPDPGSKEKADIDLRAASTAGKVTNEGWRKRKDGTLFWADVILTALREDRAHGFSLVTRDVTERKSAEEVMRRLAQLHEIDRAILGAHSPEAVAREALTRVESMIPFSFGAVLLFHWETDTAIQLAYSGDAQYTEKILPLDLGAFEELELLKNGEIYFKQLGDPLDSSFPMRAIFARAIRCFISVPLRSHTKLVGCLILGSNRANGFLPEHLDTAREVSDQLAVAIENTQLFEQLKNAHQRLQLLSQRLMEVQEIEKSHLARELHDEMGQALTVVKIRLQEIENAIPPAAPNNLKDTLLVIENLLQQVRSLSLDLRPMVLDDLGLVAALRWYLSRQSQLAGFTVYFNAVPEKLDVPPDLATACFRVAQEAITNVVRHARAHRVHLELEMVDDSLSLIIKDDGVGFDLRDVQEKASQGSSFGILGMRERVYLVGGEMEIESVPSFGTEIRVRLPLPKSEEVRA